MRSWRTANKRKRRGKPKLRSFVLGRGYMAIVEADGTEKRLSEFESFTITQVQRRPTR